MSYNIDTWKTKRIESLRMKAKDLESYFDVKVVTKCSKCGHPLSAPKIECNGDLAGEFMLRGQVEDDQFLIEDLWMTGEWSGHIYHEKLLRALKESMGQLEAVLIWEGGDHVSRLVVNDGEVKEENVEL